MTNRPLQLIRVFARTLGAGLMVCVGVSLGCDGKSPVGPSPRPIAVGTSPPPIAAAPSADPLSISALAPNVGSTGGGTAVLITGSGFQQGATVALDGYPMTAFVHNSTSMEFMTFPHDAGAVDIAVINPGDQAVKLPGGYTYALPQSFDFNGTWVGSAFDYISETEMDITFTIQGNTLTSAMCGAVPLTYARPSSVSNGEFSAAEDDGDKMFGRIISEARALGTISTRACPQLVWRAFRR